MNCQCNDVQLWKGTWELKHYYKQHMFDYLYLVCHSCNQSDEYFNDNFVACLDCKKYYCVHCKPHIIPEDFKCCMCSPSGTEHIQCEICEYWYCNVCSTKRKKGCPNCTELSHFTGP